MLRRLLPIGFILVLLFGSSTILHRGGWRTLLATANAQVPIPTLPPPVTVVPVPTSITAPTVAPGRPDLTLTVSANPDPVQAGQILSYFVTVRNEGDVGTPQVWLSGQVPVGTTIETLQIGCFEDSTTRTLRCPVIPLAPGQQASFQINLRVTTAGPSIPNRFVVDPEGFIAEINENNNSVDRVVFVTPSSATAAPTVVPTATPAGVSAAPTVVPPPPAPPVEPPPPAPEPAAPAPEPPAPPPAAQLWLEVLEPTEAWSDDGDVLWIAQPGEWYRVLVQDGAWVLAVWEDDPPDQSRWIAIDDRVALAVF